MRSAAISSAIILAVLSASCGTSGHPTFDVTETTDLPGEETATLPCDTEGDTSCFGNMFRTCTGGVWVGENCSEADRMCDDDLGCVVCRPGQAFCDGQLLVQCNEDGMDVTEMADCSAIEGAVCNAGAGACISLCDEAARENSNLGCEYWAVDLDQWYAPPSDTLNADASGEQFALVVTNPNGFSVDVTIEVNEAAPGEEPLPSLVETRTVGPLELVQIDLPQREVDGSVLNQNEGTGTALTSRAFRVSSTAPIVAYQFNPIYQMHTNDASILIPTPALDTRYWVLGYPGIGLAANPLTASETNYAFLTIVGTQPGTQVTVTATADVGPGGPVAAWTPAGTPIEATLGPFDVFNLEAHCPPEMGMVQCMTSGLTDFSGTEIVATAPVAVFAGDECINVVPTTCTGDSCCCDHLEDQIFPAVSLGKDFVAPHSYFRGGSEVDVWRILADKDGTVVSTSLVGPDASFTLDAGQWKEIYAAASFVVTSSEPLLLGQYTISQDCTSGGTGDPAFTTFPPVEQYRESYIFLVPATFDLDSAVVVRPVGAEVTIDDLGIPDDLGGCTTFPAGEIASQLYEVVQCRLEDGTHRLDAGVPVGLAVYGYGPAGSYAYPGGSNVERINIPE
jgi:hypothetical protein